jgi:hypothetical protein
VDRYFVDALIMAPPTIDAPKADKGTPVMSHPTAM